jgi:hypothetical protein
MFKINDLSEEESSYLDVVIREWFNADLSIDNSRTRAEQALKDIYSVIGKPCPSNIVWVDSPFVGSIVAHMAEQGALGEVGFSVSSLVRAILTSVIGTSSKLCEAYCFVSSEISFRLANRINIVSLWEIVRRHVYGRDSTDKISSSIDCEADYRGEILVSRTIAGMERELEVSNCCWRLAAYDFLQRWFPEEILPLKGMLEISRSCGWWYPFENFVILTSKPRKIELDGDCGLHNENGYSIEYPDGWGFCSWHGIRVPKEWIFNKGNVDPHLAITWDNVQQRRALCEILGWEKIVEHVNPKKIYEDKYGILLEIEMNDDHLPARFVKVICPSTGGKYILRVDPTVASAHEGVAATFGLTKDQYSPIQES